MQIFTSKIDVKKLIMLKLNERILTRADFSTQMHEMFYRVYRLPFVAKTREVPTPGNTASFIRVFLL